MSFILPLHSHYFFSIPSIKIYLSDLHFFSCVFHGSMGDNGVRNTDTILRINLRFHQHISSYVCAHIHTCIQNVSNRIKYTTKYKRHKHEKTVGKSNNNITRAEEEKWKKESDNEAMKEKNGVQSRSMAMTGNKDVSRNSSHKEDDSIERYTQPPPPYQTAVFCQNRLASRYATTTH